MPVDQPMTRNTNESANTEKSTYEAPHFERHDLRVVTLGGSPGSGDSGGTETHLIQGANGAREEKGFEEDWDNGG